MADNIIADYSDKLEAVYRHFERILDLDLAFSLAALTEDEKVALATDPDLAARCALCEARVKEDMMLDFRSLAKNAASEGVRLSALKELGRTVYPKRFRDDPVSLTGSVTITVIDDVK
jgi:hypothetical protein